MEIFNNNRYIIIGIVAAIIFWPLDVWIDVTFFYQESFFNELFEPDATEIYFRALASVLIISLGAGIQYGQKQRKWAEEKVQLIEQELLIKERLSQAQKMETVGTLICGITHDFNNMLIAMSDHLSLAKDKACERPDILQDIDDIERIGFRAADMLQHLLIFARKGAVSIKQISLNTFIMQEVKLLRTSVPENIELHHKVCSVALQINGDSAQLHQALLNLINNASEAVKGIDNPAITIKLEAWYPGESFIASHPYVKKKHYAHVSVKDNGCGIPEHQIKHLFEPFFTTKGQGKGTGLGLSMSFGTIKIHDGFIEVDSIEGKGSTFHLYIPLLLQAEQPVIAPADEKEIV